MAKKKKGAILVKMESSASGTKHAYYVKKNPKSSEGKWTMKKYNPRTGKHEEYKETKMPPHSK